MGDPPASSRGGGPRSPYTARMPDPWFPSRTLIGMVHVAALPGAPAHRGEPVRVIAERAAAEAVLLLRAGFDGAMIENMHDAPYLAREVGPEVVAAMTAAALAVRDAAAGVKPRAGAGAPLLGVQILAGANAAALAVAHAAGFDFIRAEGFVFASVADEGLFERADAGPLLRHRRAIGAAGEALTRAEPRVSGTAPGRCIRILADIKKKHSAHALTADVDIAETARAAEFFGADGVIVTGVATGRATSLSDLEAARRATALPLVVGSGATPDSLADLFRFADGVIAGSWFKREGCWRNEPDPARVRAMAEAMKPIRER